MYLIQSEGSWLEMFSCLAFLAKRQFSVYSVTGPSYLSSFQNISPCYTPWRAITLLLRDRASNTNTLTTVTTLQMKKRHKAVIEINYMFHFSAGNIYRTLLKRLREGGGKQGQYFRF